MSHQTTHLGGQSVDYILSSTNQSFNGTLGIVFRPKN